MFGKIIRSLDGIRLEMSAITKTLRFLSEANQDPPAYQHIGERLSAMEGRIEAVVGQAEAAIIKADAIKSAARASEERARGMEKRAREYAETPDGAEDGESGEDFETLARAYAPQFAEPDGGEIEALPTVSNGLADRRARREAIRAQKRR